MNAIAVTHEVANRFQTLRRHYRWVAFASLGLTIITMLMLGWLVLATVDYMFELPIAVRRSLLAMVIAAVTVGGALLLWKILASSGKRQFASRLETRFDELGQRLRTLLETINGRLKVPEPMLGALGNQTLGRWETAQPSQIIPRRLLTAACVAVLIVLPVVGLALSGGSWRAAMLRSAGSDVPYTTIAVSPGDIRLLEGAIADVELELTGRPDRLVTLRQRKTGEETWLESELLPVDTTNPDSHRFSSSLGKLDKSIEYQFLTSVGDSQIYKITMQPLIEVEDVRCRVAPPAYTKIAERDFSTTELTVLEGSEVTVHIQTNHPLRMANLKFPGQADSLEMEPQPASTDGKKWTFSLPSNDALRWQFAGEGEDGTPLSPVSGRLRIRRDQPPKLEWTEPGEEMTVHMLAEVPMQLQVSDDYGLIEAGIVFQLGDEEEFVLKDWSVTAQGESGTELPTPTLTTPTTRVPLQEVLPLESFLLTERDFVAYYAYAEDNRESRNQRTESEIRYIDIRPLRQFFAESDLPPGNGGGGGGGPLGLDELLRRQRYLFNRTRGVARSFTVDSELQLGLVERMVESQSELADLTRFLVDFLASVGNDDTESLSQAEVAMLQSADAMAGADFEIALVTQQDAIRFLAEARRTLEQTLSANQTPMQRQQMQQFRRQMQQKLRRKQQESDPELADDLKQIAADQAKLSGEIKDTEIDEQTAAQQDLLDRFVAVDTALSEDVKRSKLVTDRLEAGIEEMDAMVREFQLGDMSKLGDRGLLLADRLSELAEQVDAMANTEPANRIAIVRDLTASLANMEANLARGAEEKTDSPPQRSIARLTDRTLTLEDLFQQPVESASLEASDINAMLTEFAEQDQFLERLAASKTGAEALPEAERESLNEVSREMLKRAAEHASAARQLDDIFRQLVNPRIDQLRQLEAKAAAICNAVGGKGGPKTGGQQGGGEAQEDKDYTEPQDNPMTAEMLADELERALDGAGFSELAEIMRSGSAEAQDFDKQADAFDASASGRSQFSYTATQQVLGRTLMVRRELQTLLQELVLVEISSDRNMPVPAEYKSMVDAYFRSLSGQDSTSESSP